MSQLRRDPIRGHWSIIAPGRDKRPGDHGDPVPADPAESGPCPFCPGNEEQTPPEVEAVRPNLTGANQPGWLVRIVPNRYPALAAEAQPGDGLEIATELVRSVPAVGSHEIVVATPDHTRRASHFSVDQWDTLLAACQFRMQELMQDRRIKHVVLFHNHGEKAGASRSHEHLQLMGIPMTPQTVSQEVVSARAYRTRHERCIFCDVVVHEIQDRRRLVLADEAFVSFTPWASRMPYELWIVPRAHRASFLQVPHRERCLLAAHMREVLQRLEQVFGDLPYNWMLHSMPETDADADVYHWHIEFLPRLSHQAGYEWGTGGFINTTPPEDAAAELRNAHGELPAVTLSR
jgi:UDPglucose--hexose-1-phosphate uridylyltransferase